MTPALREKLDLIDGWLCDSDEGRDLWYVLSGLRGPDDQSAEMKEIKTKTTAHIRSLAFPKFSAHRPDVYPTPHRLSGQAYNVHGLEVAAEGTVPMTHRKVNEMLDLATKPRGEGGEFLNIQLLYIHFLGHVKRALGVLR